MMRGSPPVLPSGHMTPRPLNLSEMAERPGGSPPMAGERRGSWSPGGRAAKVCGVCGDRAKSYHFGGISCDSCKAFFRRSVQNEAHRHFQCPYDGRCQISISSRKCCQHCRFHKCLAIGMEKSWVMTEEERLQMLRQRMERKARAHQDPVFGGPPHHPAKPPPYKEHPVPDVETLSTYMDSNDVRLVQHVVQLHEQSAREVALPDIGGPSSPSSSNNVDLIAMFGVNIRRYTLFARRLDAFRRLSPADQGILLRTGMVEMCVLGGVCAGPLGPRIWPPPTSPTPLPHLYTGGFNPEDISRLVSPDTYTNHVRFNNGVRELNPDEPTLVLLLLTALFSPDRAGLEAAGAVEAEQGLWLAVLRRYVEWRYGRRGGGSIYAKLLLKLPDLRELNDAHAKHTLRLDHEELAQIQGRLGNLRLVEPSPCTDPPPTIVDMVFPSSPPSPPARHPVIRRF